MKTAIIQTVAIVLAVAGSSPATVAESQSVPVERKAEALAERLQFVPEPSATESTPFIDLRATESRREAVAASDTTNNSDLFVGLGVWTIIVLCLCVLTVLGIRQWQRGRGMLPVDNGSARVLETVSLGPNRMVSLVALGDVRAIVGCDAAGIRSIVLAPPSFEDALEAQTTNV